MHPEDFVESYVDAWNHRDPGCVADHFTADGIYYDIPSHAQLTRQELIEHLASWFDDNQDRYSIEGDIATGNNSIAFQYKVSTRDPRTQQDICWYGAEFITLCGNQAIRINDFYELPDATGHRNSPVNKYAKSGLAPELIEHYKEQLTALMQEERIYLDASLTLPQLSSLIPCPVNHLSQVINGGFGVSFFDYLNGYRIEEAKRILREHSNVSPPIVTVAFEVGFNSNSAFYAAFKRACGMTPAQYRKEHQTD